LVEHEPHNIAEAIELLLADDALHQRLSHGARQVAQSKWSLDSSVDRLERRLKEELSRLRPEVRGENHVDSLLVHPARVQP
jgi:glycosyltransferase involved in cell wall biosynthesis